MSLAQSMFDFAEELYPLHRSMTGEGNRQTFRHLAEQIPIVMHEVPSGTKVFDWQIPQEWKIRSAYIAREDGTRVVDYNDSNLHVLNGSSPVDRVLNWEELNAHLFSLEDQPNAIPYRTNYFRDEWGFCVPHRLREELAASQGKYHAHIDADYCDGSLTYAECTLPGASENSILIYCHTCHPSLANDNLSGLAVATFLARALLDARPYYTYRFVFAPATIGAIAWLSINEGEVVSKIDHGLVLSLLGNHAPFTYKRSRRHAAPIDQIAEELVGKQGGSSQDFCPFGYDERQFCSPGFDLPVGRLTRTPPGDFPEYHTSLDNLSFIDGRQLEESLSLCLEIVRSLENLALSQHKEAYARSTPAFNDRSSARRCDMTENETNCPVNRFPKCEPRLARYDLHRGFGHADDRGCLQQAMMWVLNLGDGKHTIERMAQRSGLEVDEIRRAATVLRQHELVDMPCDDSIELDNLIPEKARNSAR